MQVGHRDPSDEVDDECGGLMASVAQVETGAVSSK